MASGAGARSCLLFSVVARPHMGCVRAWVWVRMRGGVHRSALGLDLDSSLIWSRQGQ